MLVLKNPKMPSFSQGKFKTKTYAETINISIFYESNETKVSTMNIE